MRFHTTLYPKNVNDYELFKIIAVKLRTSVNDLIWDEATESIYKKYSVSDLDTLSKLSILDTPPSPFEPLKLQNDKLKKLDYLKIKTFHDTTVIPYVNRVTKALSFKKQVEEYFNEC